MFRIRKRYWIAICLVGAFVYVSQNYEISGWQNLKLLPKDQSSAGAEAIALGWKTTSPIAMEPNSSIPPLPPMQPLPVPITPGYTHSPTSYLPASKTKIVSKLESNDPRIRIASFNVHALNETKLRKGPVVETLARIVRQFDVIALQHISSKQNDLLPLLLEKINKSDRRYDYCIGPRVGPDGSKEQFAFVFDTDRIETDREQLYTVDDPQNLMDYEPLVGWFRAKHVSPERAFTFTLANVRIEALSVARETALLPALIRSIRSDGRIEDDVILAGDFGCSSRKLDTIPSLPMMMALDDIATTVSGESMLDNILIPTRSTDEYTGRSGAIDFLRQLNLSFDQATQVSTHLPIWAEFSAYEGGVGR